MRTGAAGAVAMKYTTPDQGNTVGFIGCGAIARNMARAAASVRDDFQGVVYAFDGAETFAKEMSAELGISFSVAESAEELCQKSNVIYTQTTGSDTVVELDWIQKGTTIIASGSDQPTKQEIPSDVLKASKYIPDLVKQTSKVGELRGAIEDGLMTEDDVYCEVGCLRGICFVFILILPLISHPLKLGDLVNGKVGREGDELIVVDLTGTGAQDAAIGQVAWDKLGSL